jgi:hypothetical protein
MDKSRGVIGMVTNVTIILRRRGEVMTNPAMQATNMGGSKRIRGTPITRKITVNGQWRPMVAAAVTMETLI